jgi:hypothetical protein
LPTNTLIGEIEVSNPFLFVIVPEKLRENEDLTTQLHVNSHKLITHYDVYATLLEIAAVNLVELTKNSYRTGPIGAQTRYFRIKRMNLTIGF